MFYYIHYKSTVIATYNCICRLKCAYMCKYMFWGLRQEEAPAADLRGTGELGREPLKWRLLYKVYLPPALVQLPPVFFKNRPECQTSFCSRGCSWNITKYSVLKTVRCFVWNDLIGIMSPPFLRDSQRQLEQETEFLRKRAPAFVFRGRVYCVGKRLYVDLVISVKRAHKWTGPEQKEAHWSQRTKFDPKKVWTFNNNNNKSQTSTQNYWKVQPKIVSGPRGWTGRQGSTIGSMTPPQLRSSDGHR